MSFCRTCSVLVALPLMFSLPACQPEEKKPAVDVDVQGDAPGEAPKVDVDVKKGADAEE